MIDFLLPYPITEVENGALLYYLILDPNLANQKIDTIKYQFVSYEGKEYCLFNDIYAVPMELFEKFDLKNQKFLYFMKYDFTSIYSELFFAFEIDDEFIINYKAYKTFLEYRKKLELETKKLNNQESLKESAKNIVEDKVEKTVEKTNKTEEGTKTLLN
jgi:hypothetical protein